LRSLYRPLLEPTRRLVLTVVFSFLRDSARMCVALDHTSNCLRRVGSCATLKTCSNPIPTPRRVLAILRMFGEIAARSDRTERTGAYSDRVDRLNPNIVFSKRDSYQRRGHLTVSEVESYRLTLPRTSTSTRLTKPRTSTKFESTRRARSDGFLLSRRTQPPLGTGKGTRRSPPLVSDAPGNGRN